MRNKVSTPVAILGLSVYAFCSTTQNQESRDSQPYEVYDLWRKNNKGNWGLSIGIYTESIPDVFIEPHQTKVWRLKQIPQTRPVGDQHYFRMQEAL
jgi:hypothetical protein